MIRLPLSVGSRTAGIIALLSVFGSFSVTAPDPETVTLPAGSYRATEATDIRPHPRDTKFYSERWDYHIALDSGARLAISFSRANLGSRHDPLCGIEMSILDFQGRDYVAFKQYSLERFLYFEEEEKLECNPRYWFKGALPQSHAIHFDGHDNGFKYLIDVELRDIQPGMSLGTGVYKFGEEEVGVYVHIPYARASATISIDGVVTEEDGTVYMDHTFMTERPPRLVDASYRYLAQTSADRWSVGYVLDPSQRYAANLIGYGLESSGGKVLFRRAVATRIFDQGRSPTGLVVPVRMELLFSKGNPLILERTSVQQELSVLSDLKGISKAIVRRYLGGEIIRFRGLGTLQGEQMLYHYDVVR